MSDTRRALATRVAWSLVGLPYMWGGDDPLAGFDCSGLVVEILKSCGVLPREGDWSANMLHQRFADAAVLVPYEGCLAFWRRGGEMTHVEYCIDRKYTIGSSGGSSTTTNWRAAVDANAYVKVRPVKPNGVFVDPFTADNAP